MSTCQGSPTSHDKGVEVHTKRESDKVTIKEVKVHMMQMKKEAASPQNVKPTNTTSDNLVTGDETIPTTPQQ